MMKDDFVSCFGGVFEYLLWVVECVFDVGVIELLIVGFVYGVMVVVFCVGIEEEWFVVLCVYFDFVGKFVIVGEFIEDSCKE